ncbi:MAG: DsbE family thiol:disulfide interchange protein [Gammaproteobacteria bacterium]|nr:DsbE family thiol:disulfide interchange protein [Gammaproteobacteria bacterium]
MMRYFAPLAIFAVIVVIFAFGLHQAPRKDLVPSPLIGKPAPSFTLPSLADPTQTVSNAALHGHWYLLNVWGTWCISCRLEAPELLAIAHTGVVPVIGLDWKDSRSAAMRYLAQRGNPYQQIAFDPGGLEAIHWGVYGAPETFIVNPQGIIVYKYIGPITPGAWTRDFLPRLQAAQTVSGS